MKKIVLATAIVSALSFNNVALADSNGGGSNGCNPAEAVTSLFGNTVGAILGGIGGVVNEIEDQVTGVEDGDDITRGINEGAKKVGGDKCRD